MQLLSQSLQPVRTRRQPDLVQRPGVLNNVAKDACTSLEKGRLPTTRGRLAALSPDRR